MGGGVALFDYDNNGTLDILFVSGTNWPGQPSESKAGSSLQLYSNDGTGAFTNATTAANLDISIYGMGCAVGDIDNDGWVDLFVTDVGGNRLFRNRQGQFEDVTSAANVKGAPDAWSSSAGFFDYDHDGHLDLLVCNYVKWSREIDIELNFTLNGVDRAYGPPTNYEGTQPYLYRNNGDGTFAEVAHAAGLHIVNPDREVPVGKGLAVLLIDLNQDGWEDVLIANDTVRNFLFVNQGNGKFKEIGVDSGVAYDRAGRATGAMGIDVGNVWNDKTQIIAIGNFANEMTSVYVSQRDALCFSDEASSLGIGAPSRQRLTFGVLWGDFDLDGRLDLVQANGHIEDSIETIQPSQTYKQSAQIFWNKGMDSEVCFIDLPAETMGDLATPIVGRGAASGDLDGDGDLDLVITQIDGPPLVLRNGQATGNHYLRVKLIGTKSNRYGYGSRIQVDWPENCAVRHLSPTRSYLSQVEPVASFGIGQQVQVDSVRVFWPSGRVSELKNVAADQSITLTEPEQAP